MQAPITITKAESAAVYLTPILSRITPAKIKKRKKTFKKYSDPANTPKFSDDQPRSVSRRLFNGDKTSTNM